MTNETKRNRFWAVATMAAAAWGLLGCATARPSAAIQVEEPRPLTAGPSVWAPPVHATTDLVDTFEESRPRPASKRAAPAAAPAVTEDAPEVAPKADGVEIGEVRQ